MPQACVTPSTTATAVARAPLGGNEPYQHEPRATSAQRAVYKVQLGYVLLPPELNLLRQAQQQPPPLPPPPPPHAEPVANTASREPRRYRGSLATAAAGVGMIFVLPQHTAAACAIQAAQRRRRDRQTFLKLQRVIWAALQLPVRQVLRRLAPPREGRLLADLPDEAPPLLPCPLHSLLRRSVLASAPPPGVDAQVSPTLLLRLAGPSFPPRLLFKVVCCRRGGGTGAAVAATAADPPWLEAARDAPRLSTHQSNHWRRVACRAPPPAGLAPSSFAVRYACLRPRPTPD